MWSPDPPTITRPRGGWIGDTTPDVAAPRRGWMLVSGRRAIDSGVGDDHALATPSSLAIDTGIGVDSLYMGLDPANDFEVRVPVRDCGIGDDLLAILLDATTIDSSVGDDLATLGLSSTDDSIGDDLAGILARTPVRDSGLGADLASDKPRIPGRDTAVGDSLSQAAFTPHAPESTTITTSGTWRIPAWCRYIDIIAIGGGGSGQTGSGLFGQAGKGGIHGTWASTTITRGDDIPWTAIDLTISIGSGGARPANSDLAGPNAGQPTTVTASSLVLSAAGGSGTGDYQNGRPVPDYTAGGVTDTGGASGTGNAGTGQAPGGAGAGGNGGIFGSRTRGGAGGAGRAWIIARQT